jgi:SAM-dependent methyltransferase
MKAGHYGASYFAWQRGIGEAGATLNQTKFLPYVRSEDTVLDFGCGGGALLAALPGREKVGIEVGADAAATARERGLTVYQSTERVGGATVDVVISNHALEHVERPLDELRELWRVLKPGGRAVFVVPINDWRSERTPDPMDRNHHLYTWTPLLFANLLGDAGFEVESCRVLTHAWRPEFLALQARAPMVYGMAAWLLAVTTRRRQIRAVARKP